MVCFEDKTKDEMVVTNCYIKFVLLAIKNFVNHGKRNVLIVKPL